MSSTVSPLAPTNVPDLPAIEGVRLATAQAGIRYKNRTDVLLVAFEKGTAVAGVFTRSKCPSAPVEWCRAHLKSGKARALVVNSGNANAFTGKSGRAATALTAKLAAQALSCPPNEVFLASTGVIGEPLDATKFDGVLQTLLPAVPPSQDLTIGLISELRRSSVDAPCQQEAPTKAWGCASTLPNLDRTLTRPLQPVRRGGPGDIGFPLRSLPGRHRA